MFPRSKKFFGSIKSKLDSLSRYKYFANNLIKKGNLDLDSKNIQVQLSLYSSYLIERKDWAQLIDLFDKILISSTKKTVLFVGNCQVTPLSRIVELSNSYCSEYHSFNLLPDIHNMAQELQNIVVDYLLPNTDILVTQNIINKEYPLNTENSKNLCRTITIPTLYFAGYYPDIIYLKQNNQTIRTAPIIDYHSSFILHSFSEGISENSCITTLKDGSWIGENYLQNIENIFDSLYDREREWDVKITDYLYNNFKEKLLFHTVNHPGSDLLTLVATTLSSLLNLGEFNSNKLLVIPDFLNRTKWILNKKIADQLNMDPNTQLKFNINGSSMSVDKFVKTHYTFYRENPTIVKDNIERCKTQNNKWVN